jgi:hypothetical protein
MTEDITVRQFVYMYDDWQYNTNILKSEKHMIYKMKNNANTKCKS